LKKKKGKVVEFHSWGKKKEARHRVGRKEETKLQKERKASAAFSKGRRRKGEQAFL